MVQHATCISNPSLEQGVVNSMRAFARLGYYSGPVTNAAINHFLNGSDRQARGCSIAQ